MNSPVSLFLHSTGTGPSMWADVPEAVTEGTRKVAPPNLGYPPLEPVARGSRVTADDDARNALAQMGEGAEVDLFAHSYGAVVALRMVPLLGSRVRSLFLFEPVLFAALAKSGMEASADARRLVDDPTFLGDDEAAGSDAWLATFVDYWNRPGSWARLPESARTYGRAVSWKMVEEVRSCFFDLPSFDDIVLPRVPTTFVMAERSPEASRAMTKALSERNPHAVLVDLEGTGHMAPLTHGKLVHGAMLEHRRRISTFR